jgi:hypothetical protein
MYHTLFINNLLYKKLLMYLPFLSLQYGVQSASSKTLQAELGSPPKKVLLHFFSFIVNK